MNLGWSVTPALLFSTLGRVATRIVFDSMVGIAKDDKPGAKVNYRPRPPPRRGPRLPSRPLALVGQLVLYFIAQLLVALRVHVGLGELIEQGQ